MAILYPSHIGQNWSNPAWSIADDGAENHVKPAIGDSVAFTANSGGVDIDENPPALAGMDMTGYTAIFGSVGVAAYTINVDGNLTLGGMIDVAASSLLFEVTGNIEALTGLTVAGDVSIKHNDVAANARTVKTRGLCGGIKFEINNPGITSLTAVEDGGTTIAWKSFVLAINAKYAGGAFAHEIGGNILIDSAASVFTTTGTWEQTASGDVKNTKTTWTKLILAGTGVTSRLTDTTHCAIFEHGAGAVTESGARTLYIRFPANDFWVAGTGSITIHVVQIYSAASREVGDMYLSNVDAMQIRFTAGNTLTMTGDLNAPNTLVIPRSEAAGIIALDMNGHSLTGGVRLGGTDADRRGKIYFRDATHTLTSLQSALATHVGNAVDFGSSSITLSGTIDGKLNAGTDLVLTNTAARIMGGTVQDCDCSGTNILTCFGTTDGGGNVNVVFDSGGLLLLGVGG